MEQLRQIGEVLGSLKTLMVFRDNIQINQRQCLLLVDAFNLAFEVVTDEIRSNLLFEERITKWKALEHPLKELHTIFREGELYIRRCLETRDWWVKAISLNQNTDCVDVHLCNLLWCIPVVVEAIECVAEITGSQQEEINQRRLFFSKKYEKEWMEPLLFQHKFGKQYLVSPHVCHRMDTVFREDQWILSEMIGRKKNSGFTKQESRLSELLLTRRGKFFPSSVLMNSKDYQFRRRLGSGGQYKEVQWMGESFVIKHLIGEIEVVAQEVSLLSSIAHPNLMHVMYAFSDEEKKECFLVMELMNKDLASYIREVCSARRRNPFSLLVAVDIMLQIARGMEYLHSQKVYHGSLSTSNILVRTKSSSPDGYLVVKVTGYGITKAKTAKSTANQTDTDACIWYAPEVLAEQEQPDLNSAKYTEEADVYSYGMVCFQLLTGKVPFEDSHLQGDKMTRNIQAGERPLFPSQSPKYLANMVKKCWHADALQRPNFWTLCRMLRYMKRFLILNPEHGQPDSPGPPVDYFDLDMSLSKACDGWTRKETANVSEIPFQMFAYRVLEREKTGLNLKCKSSESGSETASACEDDTIANIIALDDSRCTSITSSKTSQFGSDTSKSSQVGSDSKKSSAKKVNGRTHMETVSAGLQQKVKSTRPLHVASCSQSSRMNSERHQRRVVSSPSSRRTSGHNSDAETQ